SGLHRWACRLEPYLSWRSLAERRHRRLGVRGGLGKLPLAGHHTDAHGRPPQQYGSARSIKHFQQKCAAVLRWTMRRSEHFQQKCAAVLRWTMRRSEHFQQKCAAVLRWTMRRSEHFQQKCAALLRWTMRENGDISSKG